MYILSGVTWWQIAWYLYKEAPFTIKKNVFCIYQQISNNYSAASASGEMASPKHYGLVPTGWNWEQRMQRFPRMYRGGSRREGFCLAGIVWFNGTWHKCDLLYIISANNCKIVEMFLNFRCKLASGYVNPFSFFTRFCKQEAFFQSLSHEFIQLTVELVHKSTSVQWTAKGDLQQTLAKTVHFSACDHDTLLQSSHILPLLAVSHELALPTYFCNLLHPSSISLTWERTLFTYPANWFWRCYKGSIGSTSPTLWGAS